MKNIDLYDLLHSDICRIYSYLNSAYNDKGARSIVDEVMKDLTDFGLLNRGGGNA